MSETRTCNVREDLNPYLTAVCLAGIVALGVIVRLYRIEAESVWWDEFTSLTHMGASSLWKFLKLNRTLDPATFPLYYSLEYLWYHYIASSVHSLRLFSILIGMASVLLLYVFGRDLFGKRAGLAAALCMALSPNHIHHSQGIRMYVLMTLLALLSAYTFMHLVQSWKGRWWAAHLASNFLLLWTHPFALLLLGVEAVFLILFRRRPLKSVATWVGAHCLLVLPSAIYLSQVSFWSPQSTGSWMRMPSFFEFLGDLFADDVVSLTYQLRLSDYWVTSPLRYGLDGALAVVLVGSCAWFGWNRYTRRDTDRKGFQDFLFLAAWLLAPALVLYAASLIWRPCVFPRYTLHSSLALYLMIGGAISVTRNTWKSVGATAAIAGLIGFQWVALQPGPQRTDWQSASALVRSQAQSNDLVLVHVSIWRDVFEYNLGASDLAIASAESIPTLARQAGFFLEQCRQSDADKGRLVWAVVLRPYFDSGPNREFEDALKNQGLEFVRTEFGGIEHVLVYKITSGRAGPIKLDSVAEADRLDVSKAFANLGLALAGAKDYRLAMVTFRWLFEFEPGSRPTYGNLQRALEKNGEIENTILAVRALLRAQGDWGRRDLDAAQEALLDSVHYDPKYALAYMDLVPICWARANGEATALRYLRTARSLDSNEEISKQLAVRGLDLAEAKDYRTAMAIFRWLFDFDATCRPIYGNLELALETGAGIEPATRAVRALRKGWLAQSHRDQAGAQEAFRAAFQYDPNYALALRTLAESYVGQAMSSLVEENDEAAAVESLRKACALDAAHLDPRMGYFLQLLENKDYQGILAGTEQSPTPAPQAFIDWLKGRIEASKIPAKSN